MPYVRKKNQNLPVGFIPTKEQKYRLKTGCVVRVCQNCGSYFTSKPILQQMFCSKCYRHACGLYLKSKKEK